MEPEIVVKKNSWSFNLFSYKGRVGRQKYIVGLIVAAVLSAIIEFLYFFIIFSSITLLLSKAGFLTIIFMFILGIVVAFIPVFLTSTVIVKRFHDIGKSGWWWFILLIPLYNIHLAIGLLTERGTIGPNQYGEDNLPLDIPDDIFNRFSQSGTARVIADIIIIGLCLLFFALSMMSSVKNKVQQQTAQQNIINQIVQSAACGDSTLTPEQLITPDKTWETYTSPKTKSFSGFSFQYPTTYMYIKNIHLTTTPEDSVGIITNSQNPDIVGFADIGVDVSATNGRSPEEILSMNQYPGRIYTMKDFETGSGIAGKEMVVKINNPSACGGSQTIETKILLDLPQTQSSNEPTVIVFDFNMQALRSNNLIESIAKTFTTTNIATTNSLSGNQGTNTPGKATITSGIYPSGCYTVTYDPKSLIANKDEVHEGNISFTDLKGNPVFDAVTSYSLGDVNTVAAQIASRFPGLTVRDFVTTSGTKGKELIETNWWAILIPTASQQNGETIILDIGGSNNLTSLKNGEDAAKSVSSKLNCG